MSRIENMEKLLDELAPVIDGDRDALARHADFLADDDEARDLKHDAIEAAERLARAGADYVPPADLEARLWRRSMRARAVTSCRRSRGRAGRRIPGS